MRSGAEIQSALRAFASRWEGYNGSERSEAQTFLNELFECYGSNRKDDEPLFNAQNKELTTEAAGTIAELYRSLLDRQAAKPQVAGSSVMQMTWCFFAEHYGLLDGRPAQHLLKALIDQPFLSSYMILGGLFDVLNEPTNEGRHGPLKGTRYVNGDPFAHAAKVHLDALVARVLRDARAHLSAVETAQRAGLSRVSARRYLRVHGVARFHLPVRRPPAAFIIGALFIEFILGSVRILAEVAALA